MPQVKVTIDHKTGKTTIDGVGFEGPECLSKLQSIANAVGVTTSMVAKPEFYHGIEEATAQITLEHQ